MNDINYARQLIKGRIAEVVFEQMFRKSGKYTILQFGYEHTVPELAQYQHMVEVKRVLENIKNAPDFILISQDKSEVYLVEVKFKTVVVKTEIKEMAEKLLNTRNPSWLFIASLSGFYFGPCNEIVHKDGEMGPLFEKWADKETRDEYLKLLNEFERKSLI